MGERTFKIETSDSSTCWATLQDNLIAIHRTPRGSTEDDEVLVQWDIDVLRNLLEWASQESAVTAFFSGPLAHQIREYSRELGMTPEMFVWHAVKVFIEVGART